MDNVFVVVRSNCNNRVIGVFEDHQEAVELVDDLNEISNEYYFMYSVDFYGKED